MNVPRIFRKILAYVSLAYASTRLELATVALDEVAPDQIDEWACCKVAHEHAAERYRHAKALVRALEAEARG